MTCDGAEAELALLDELADEPRLRDYHPQVLARADLLHRLVRLPEATTAYERALSLAGSEPERTHVRERLAVVTKMEDTERMETVYEAAGGAEGLLRLAHAWHQRVMADEIVSHAFAHGFRADHSERLAAYWGEALGGPAAYSGAYGDETYVVRLHSGNGEHDEMNRRAIACFDEALADAGLAEDDRLRGVLHDYFARATTTSMYHHTTDDMPDGLSIPQWSWDGLQEAAES